MSDLVGRHLGRYQLEKLVGRGGMAEVYKAHDDRLGRAVAVKVIRPMHAEEPGFIERFLREARLVAQLEHAHILPVYDFGEEEGRPYLVMPLVPGGTLLQRLQAAPPPRALVTEWMQQLGSALDAAHAKGILHRDIKPANVLVGEGDRLLLADFGIARMWHSSTGLTATGTVVGTPLYLAPEVAQGAKASPASDRYSLAVIAYEMLGGSPPFEAENPLSILHQHVTSPVPALSLRGLDLPAEVDTVFGRALAKTPEERPRSGRDLAAVLQAVLSSEDLERTLPLPSSGSHLPATRVPPDPAPAVWTPAGGTTPPPATGLQRLGRGAFWSLAVVVLVLVGLSALQFLKRGDASQRASASIEQNPREGIAAADPTPTARHDSGAAEVESFVQEPAAGESEPNREMVEMEAMVEKASPPSHDDQDARLGPPLRRGPSQRSLPVLEEAGRVLGHRRTREEFVRMKERAGKALHPQSKILEGYATGGLAYIDGRSSEAVTILVRLLANERSTLMWGGAIVTILRELVASGEALEAWQIDLAYGDPGKQAGSRLAKARAQSPDDLGPRLGEAMLARLDGRHRKAVELAHGVWSDERLDGRRSAVAQFIAEEFVLIGDAPEAMAWYKRAVESGGSKAPFIAFQASLAVARDLGRPEEAARFMEVACEHGFQPACRELDQGGRSLQGRRKSD